MTKSTLKRPAEDAKGKGKAGGKGKDAGKDAGGKKSKGVGGGKK